MVTETLSAATHLRPEAELLLCCAQRDAEPAVRERIENLVQGEVDWTYLLQTAADHGVAPLLYRALNATSPQAVPQDVLDQLQNRFRANGRRNVLLTGELLGLLRSLKAQGIPAVPYKGPVLAVHAYGNLALREFSDLDVLIRKDDIPRAKDIMASLGYRPEKVLFGAQEEAYLRSQHVYDYTNDKGTIVELHWALVPRKISFSLDPADLWTRLGEVDLGGSTMPTFSPEDTLLILCVHGSKHRWKRLAWVCDVAETIKAHPGIDWKRLLAQAGELRGERMLFMGLFLASDLLGAPLPEYVLERVRADRVVYPLAERVTEGFFVQDEDSQGLLEGSSFRALYLGMREGLPDKIRYCVHTAMSQSTEDWELVPLPRFLYPVYYVLRLIRLALKYGRKVLYRALRRNS
jgi:hypothetical protein